MSAGKRGCPDIICFLLSVVSAGELFKYLLTSCVTVDTMEAPDEDGDGDEAVQSRPAAPLCACGEPSRYRCPACDTRSCSLACVNKHKAAASCTGVRDPGKYRKVQDFNDTELVRDYRFLEGAVRAIDSGKRTRRETEKPANVTRQSGLTPARQNLLRHARERGVQLELLPHGMTRQRENTTRYDGRRQAIGWRVEMRFVDAGVLHVVPCVPEGCTLLQLLRSCLETGLTLEPLAEATPEAAGSSSAGDAAAASAQDAAAPAAAAAAAATAAPTRREDGQRALLRHKLRAYAKAGAPALRVYLPAECRRADDQRYYSLLVGGTLGEALRGKAVIESPIVHVALPPPSDAAGDARYPLLETTAS